MCRVPELEGHKTSHPLIHARACHGQTLSHYTLCAIVHTNPVHVGACPVCVAPSDNFFVLFSAVVLSLVAVPWLVLLLVLLVPVYYQVQAVYRRTSRELNRIDGVTKSPIFGACSESLFARVTVRAFGTRDYFTARTDGMIDHNLKVSTWRGRVMVGRCDFVQLNQ